MSKENKEAVANEAVANANLPVNEVDFQALLKAEIEKAKAEVRAELQAEMQAAKAELSKEQAEAVGTEKKVKVLVRSMKDKLDKLQKVTIKIPIDKQNPKDLTCFAQINGYTYTIKRGEEVEVPIAVKKLLERAKVL